MRTVAAHFAAGSVLSGVSGTIREVGPGGAGKIALGVGGGILAADAISSIFDGGGLFGGDRDYGSHYSDQGDFGGGDFDGGSW